MLAPAALAISAATGQYPFLYDGTGGQTAIARLAPGTVYRVDPTAILLTMGTGRIRHDRRPVPTTKRQSSIDKVSVPQVAVTPRVDHDARPAGARADTRRSVTTRHLSQRLGAIQDQRRHAKAHHQPHDGKDPKTHRQGSSRSSGKVCHAILSCRPYCSDAAEEGLPWSAFVFGDPGDDMTGSSRCSRRPFVTAERQRSAAGRSLQRRDMVSILEIPSQSGSGLRAICRRRLAAPRASRCDARS